MGVRRPLEGNGRLATPPLVRLAWALGTVAIAMVAVTVLRIVRARGVQLPPGFQPPSALGALQFVGAAIVGAVLAALRPRNPVGWLLLGLGLCFVIYPLVVAYVTTALFVAPAGLPAVRWVAWVGNWIWVPGHGCIVLLFLLFPAAGCCRLAGGRSPGSASARPYFCNERTFATAMRPGWCPRGCR